MGINDAPSNKPEEIAKPLTLKEFLTLKVGQKFWVILGVKITKIPHDPIGPLVIKSFQGTPPSVVDFFSPNHQSFGVGEYDVADLVSQNKVFLTKEDAEKSLKKEAGLN